MRHCKADLIKSFGENYLPNEWAQTTGKRPVAPGLPRGSLQVPQSIPDPRILSWWTETETDCETEPSIGLKRQ